MRISRFTGIKSISLTLKSVGQTKDLYNIYIYIIVTSHQLMPQCFVSERSGTTPGPVIMEFTVWEWNGRNHGCNRIERLKSSSGRCLEGQSLDFCCITMVVVSSLVIDIFRVSQIRAYPQKCWLIYVDLRFIRLLLIFCSGCVRRCFDIS